MASSSSRSVEKQRRLEHPAQAGLRTAPEQSVRDEPISPGHDNSHDPVIGVTEPRTLDIDVPDWYNSFGTIEWLPASLRKRLAFLNVTTPTPIQKLALAAAANSMRVSLLHAQTGTGKTLAYLLPILAAILRPHTRTRGPSSSIGGEAKSDSQTAKLPVVEKGGVNALIIVPSRELGMQTLSVICELIEGKMLSSHISQDAALPEAAFLKSIQTACTDTHGAPFAQLCVAGVETVEDQFVRLQRGAPRILIGTPDRLMQVLTWHQEPRQLLQRVSFVVVDEADKVLKPPSRYAQPRMREHIHVPVGVELVDLVYGVNPSVRMSFVSATINAPLKGVIHRQGWQHQPRALSSMEAEPLPSKIEHVFTYCTEYEKLGTLCAVVKQLELKSALVFVHGNVKIDDVVRLLSSRGFRAVALYKRGNDSPAERAQLLQEVQSGKVQLLISTEETARGIDLPDLSHVIIMHSPDSANSYLHMAGRTGRLGRPGTVISIVSYDEARQLELQMKALRIASKPVQRD